MDTTRYNILIRAVLGLDRLHPAFHSFTGTEAHQQRNTYDNAGTDFRRDVAPALVLHIHGFSFCGLGEQLFTSADIIRKASVPVIPLKIIQKRVLQNFFPIICKSVVGITSVSNQAVISLPC